MAMKRPTVSVKVGDTVLIGAPGVSMPGDWFFATVILVCDGEVATEHMPPSQSGMQRQFFPISYIRGAGEYPALREFQERARAEVADLKQPIKDAELALDAARAAVWQKLDALAEEVAR